MSTFEMLNHQLKHMFGGIEPEQNGSIAELENFQRRIVKAMEKAQNCHKKIYQGATIIKNSLSELSENYMALFREGKYSGTLIGKVHNEVNKFLQEVCEESLSLSKKMEGKVQNFIPNLRKIKQKYIESAQTFEHYRQKLELLKKNVQKQSLANISKDQHERFERNKDKYRNAEKEHDEILVKITKRFYEFNSEGLKDIFHDFISVVSMIGGNICGISYRLRNNLTEHSSTKDLILAKQFNPSLRSGSRAQSKEQKAQMLNCLIEERQISNFLKLMMEKEMTKIEASQKIQSVFNKKEASAKENNVDSFEQFKNQYNSLHLIHHQAQHQAIEQHKETDPIEACQDLLSAEELSQMSRGISGDSIISNDISLSFDESLTENKKSHQKDQKIKQNLQKFNQICEQKKNNSPPLKNINSFPLNTMQFKAVPPKQQKTVDANQFFNFVDKNKKEQKISKPQKQLVKMHEHVFNFDLLMPVQTNQQKKSVVSPISSYSSNNNIKNVSPKPINNFVTNNKNFETFDFFGQQLAKSSKNLSKTPSKIGQLKSNEMLPRSNKPVVTNFDLLNF